MKITYLFDPLCGWCYGARPALKRIRALDGVKLTLAPTGLFAGSNARAMDENFAKFAWQNDQQIARRTGQVFSEAYRRNLLTGADGIFDSAPASLALTAVSLTSPEREFDVLGALQDARYVHGLDNCRIPVVQEVLVGLGLPEAAFLLGALDESLLATYRTRLELARANLTEFNITGVPAIILDENGQRRILSTSALFGDFASLEAQIMQG